MLPCVVTGSMGLLSTERNRGSMILFHIDIKVYSVVCYQVTAKPKKAREIFRADGVVFYATGAIGNRFDKIANIAMNKMFEIGRKPRELRTV